MADLQSLPKEILSVRAVDFAYPSTRSSRKSKGTGRFALRGVSLSVSESKITAIVGRNGSGKSTLLRILLGHARPEKGSVLVRAAGMSRGPGGLSELQELRGPLGRALRLGVVSQTNSLDPKLTVAQNLDLAGALFGLERSVRQHRSQELLRRFGISDASGSQVSALSGGQKRRLDIVRALMSEPELLILDEPGAGLDHGTLTRLWADLRVHLKTVEGGLKAILFVSHQNHELEAADSFLVMYEGQASRQVSRAEVEAEPQWDRLVLGLKGAEGAQRLDALREHLQAQGCTVSPHDETQQSPQLAVSALNARYVIPKIFDSEFADIIASVEMRQEDLLDRVLRCAQKEGSSP